MSGNNMRGLEMDAAQVAKQLPRGYKVDLHNHADRYVRLVGPGGATLYMSVDRDNASRLHIAGAIPPEGSGLIEIRKPHSIRVARSRGTTAIVNEIKRRLLPDYLRDLKRAQEAIKAHDWAREDRENVAAQLKAEIPSLTPITNKDHIQLSNYHSERTYGTIDVYGGDCYVKVELHGRTEDLVSVFARALGRAAEGLRPFSSNEIPEPEEWTRDDLLSQLRACRDEYDGQMYNGSEVKDDETIEHALSWAMALVDYALDMAKDGRL